LQPLATTTHTGNITSGRIILRPLAKRDAAQLRRIHSTPEVARWWELPDDDFPFDEPESTRLTIEVDGEARRRDAAL
jgi:RimJ/RimL family protein N-acetyltransferase